MVRYVLFGAWQLQSPFSHPSYFCFTDEKVIWVWSDMRVSKWQDFHSFHITFEKQYLSFILSYWTGIFLYICVSSCNANLKNFKKLNLYYCVLLFKVSVKSINVNYLIFYSAIYIYIYISHYIYIYIYKNWAPLHKRKEIIWTSSMEGNHMVNAVMQHDLLLGFP